MLLKKPACPREALPFVLSPAQAKGLDFHSVCVLNGGALLRQIVDERSLGSTHQLRKRLSIDQLRVVLSRPTERLIWVDTTSDPATVKEVGRLLRSSFETSLPPISAEALRACLNEEELELEERIQRCQRDAQQLVSVKPDLAWSRAHQAIALLGTPGDVGAVMDPAARQLACMTLAEVCFLLAFRKQTLSAELGRPDLYHQAAEAARVAGKALFANLIRAVGDTESRDGADHLNRIATVIQMVPAARQELPAWFLVEITPRARFWVDELDRNLEAGDNPLIGQRILPPFFDALDLPDAQAAQGSPWPSAQCRF